ncbi:MAG: ADP-ribosylglycohydrolase family protein [Balneolaceae bacterium]|nr:ADP-ribosylglycohydrolase family protein [Balneolaceae bacterium]
MRFTHLLPSLFLIFAILVSGCTSDSDYTLSKETLRDKIKGAWAAQTIGVTFGGPTEFRYQKRIIPDSVELAWSDSMMYNWMTERPMLYDDIYMDLTFVEVLEEEGLDAPARAFAKNYAEAPYWLWHANQQGRYNLLNGMEPPASGHWKNNPHADDIDFQIEADFAGIMNPGLPASAMEICDRVGHIMNSGDGYYGGLFVAGMYSYAFVMEDIPVIVQRALELIPESSTFHRTIADVMKWHREHPDDWKHTWRLVEQRWGNDIGCPSGVLDDYNIDARLNAAYVVMGLLYGDGDFGRTLEIATRAGQDSDCNPATAAAILATVKGYEAIPERWSRGLALIEDMDFEYTTTSLNDVYELSYRHALEMIRRSGGDISGSEVRIPKQQVRPAPLEQNFPGYAVSEKRPISLQVTRSGSLQHEWTFEGIGVVLRGKVGNLDHPDAYALLTPEETLDDAVVVADFYIDGQLMKRMELPLNFLRRSYEPFFQYELEPGGHTLRMEVTGMPRRAYLQLTEMIVYVEEQ